MASPLDWKKTLQLLNDKETVANDLAEMLERELPILRQQLQSALTHEDLDTVRHCAHKLRGICCYFSVPKLKSLAQSLENQIKILKLKKPTVLSYVLHELCDEIDRVLHALHDRDEP